MAPYARRSAVAAESSSTPSSQYVAIVLDITGSMGSQIEGVKQAVCALIPLLAENPSLGIAIITFTEGGRDMRTGLPGCYISVDVFAKPWRAAEFVRNIRLGVPPGDPLIMANGVDGDENAKAALHALKRLDGTKPTVAFFITDAGYHRSKRDSPTAKAEEEFLLAQGGVSDTDFYILFDSVLAHFGGNLVVIPIVYGFEQLGAHIKQAYGQVAMTSGSGVVIQPVWSSSRTLSTTMAAFVTRLLAQLNGQTDLPPEPHQEMLAELRLLDATHMTRVERDLHVPPGPYPREGDAGILFASAMTRAVTAFQMSWKRRINVDKVSLLRQLVFGLTAAKFVFAVSSGNPIAEDLLTRLKLSYPDVLEAVPAEHRGQIKASPEVIETLAADLAAKTTEGATSNAAAGSGGEKFDAVTLETVRETLGTALDDEIRWAGGDEEFDKLDVDPLEAVFSMVHGIFVNVRFPRGANGKPNFADAWSAMIDRHSFDVVSAESAVRMFKDSKGVDAYHYDGDADGERGREELWYEAGKRGGGVAVGLTDRREYNGFIPLMDEGDPLKTTVMRIFSGLQVMNLVQMTILEGSPGGFLPSMYPGMVAATLARVIRTSAGGSWAGLEGAAGEANDSLASQMVFSLKGIIGAPAKAVRLRLKFGKADPGNPPSKFLMVLCKQPRVSKEDEEAFRMKMRLVLDEWVAATVQLYFGKATPENDEKFHAFLEHVIPLEAIFGKDALNVNSLEKLHPLEIVGGKDGSGFPALEGWKATALANLVNTALYKDIGRLADRCRAVFGCLDMEYNIDDIALDYVVYRFRTARYEFVERPGSPKASTSPSAAKAKPAAGTAATSATFLPGEKGSHELIQNMPSTLTLLVKSYRKALHRELVEIREARRVHAINLLKKRVLSARALTAETRSMQLLGTTYSLRRTDVPSLLNLAGYDKEDSLAFVEQLVLGDWTPDPPQCLRRFSTEIIDGVNAAGGGGAGGLSERLRDAISQRELCLRTVSCNRHGHTADLRYPGPMGWTKPYAMARRDNLTKSDRTASVSGKPWKIIPRMRQYTEFGTELLRRLDDEGGEGIEVLPLSCHPAASTNKKTTTRKAGQDELVGGSEGAGGGVRMVVVTPAQLKTDVRRALYWYDDANCLPLARKKIEKLGIPRRLVEGL
ncbi:unnamed protein product [Scytosiphon promiscuus]